MPTFHFKATFDCGCSFMGTVDAPTFPEAAALAQNAILEDERAISDELSGHEDSRPGHFLLPDGKTPKPPRFITFLLPSPAEALAEEMEKKAKWN